MIKEYKGMKAARFQGREHLPQGGYVVKILDAKEVEYNGIRKLEISFDIAAGEYKDFYRQDYKAQTMEDKKWRGVIGLYLPKEDGSEKDEWTKRSFKGMTSAVEDSNPGYHWDWNEQGLKGKIVGLLYRNEEYDFNGHQGWSARPFRFIHVEKVRDGEFTLPKDKPLDRSKSAPGNNPFSAETMANITNEDDLPF